MARLIACSACRAQISSEAKACPQCGQPVVKAGAGLVTAGGVLGVIGFLMFLSGGASCAYGISRIGFRDEDTFGNAGFVVIAASVGLMVPGIIMRAVGHHQSKKALVR